MAISLRKTELFLAPAGQVRHPGGQLSVSPSRVYCIQSTKYEVRCNRHGISAAVAWRSWLDSLAELPRRLSGGVQWACAAPGKRASMTLRTRRGFEAITLPDGDPPKSAEEPVSVGEVYLLAASAR